MINKNEISTIIVATLVIAFSITLIETWNLFYISLASVFAVLLINSIAKKLTSHYFDSKININFWEFRRYGLKNKHSFKKPVPAGAFLPLLSKLVLFPLGGIVWMASLTFDVKPSIHRHAKRHGLYKFSEMTENHIGLIAASGIAANLIFALIGYLLNFPEFAKYSIWYSFFNLIPISNLDGNRIFFGNISIWSILAIISAFSLLLSFFIV